MRERRGLQGQSLDMRERRGQQSIIRYEGEERSTGSIIRYEGEERSTGSIIRYEGEERSSGSIIFDPVLLKKIWRVGLGRTIQSLVASTMRQLFSKSTKEFLANRERDFSRHCTLKTQLRDRSSYGPCVVLLIGADFNKDIKSYGSAAILQPSLPPTFVSRSDFPYYNPDTSHRKVFPYPSPGDSP